MQKKQSVPYSFQKKKKAQTPIQIQNFTENGQLNIILTESNSFHTMDLDVSTKLITTTCLNVCKRTQLLCSSQVKTHANNGVMLLSRS